jgi:guanosine-3',5'-bis(diphosphate) 3'-pyrophosphohydrolase
LFKVNLRMVVENKPGMLAMIAGIIADAGSNIDNVNMEEADNSVYTGVNFTVQVRDRVHLADLMRAIRKIPSVVRINRAKGNNVGNVIN